MRSRRAARGRPPATAREPDSAEAAYADAVKRLARQPQSRATLAQRLQRAGYAEAAVAAALDRAVEDGYLNDEAFAASLVRRRAGSRGHGLIAQELRAKGIGESAAEPALAQLDAGAEQERALSLGRRLLAGRQVRDRQALLSFLAPRLARRGFGTGVVYRVCQLLSSEWEAAHLFDSVSEGN